mmetsp:Transcript_44264/g.116336  ORF Transcript_44264/g.116336 Transcript_44264/m.116336 type:complete len:384 (-) Transcript_44264:285-1436(-)
MADDDDDEDGFSERKHFSSVIRAFDDYERWANGRLNGVEADYRRLSAEHRKLLNIDAKVEAMRAAVRQNASVLSLIVEPHRAHVGAIEEAAGLMNSSSRHASGRPSESDMEKLQSTLKQFIREWGAEGADERDASQEPLLAALERALPGGMASGARVLVPGAGLGRLAWEVAKRGYQAQASEFSYFMLIASNFILNGLQSHGSVSVCPWVLQTCNVKTCEDQVRACPIPDVQPWSLPPTANLSMCAGDFVSVYQDQHAQWDAILTMFFIDTAHNIVEYIRLIRQLLVPGGAWVSLGPLLWHYADTPDELSVDLTWAEVRALIVDAGFVIEHEAWHRCPYVRNVRSMYLMEYDCVCFVARWPHAAASRGPADGVKREVDTEACS